jgi:hypothetical protein
MKSGSGRKEDPMKRSFFHVFLVAIVSLGCAAGSSAQDTTKAMPSAEREVAQLGLRDLMSLVNEQNASLLGFRSVDEAKGASLGAPIARRVVGYDRLLASQAGAPISSLYVPPEQRVYPVQAGSTIRCVILMNQRDGRWVVSSIGDAYLGDALRDALPAQPPGSTLMLISIPGLNIDLVGFERGATLTLLPVRDYPEAKLTRMTPVESNVFVPAIVAYARDFEQRYGALIRQRRLTN